MDTKQLRLRDYLDHIRDTTLHATPMPDNFGTYFEDNSAEGIFSIRISLSKNTHFVPDMTSNISDFGSEGHESNEYSCKHISLKYIINIDKL